MPVATERQSHIYRPEVGSYVTNEIAKCLTQFRSSANDLALWSYQLVPDWKLFSALGSSLRLPCINKHTIERWDNVLVFWRSYLSATFGKTEPLSPFY